MSMLGKGIKLALGALGLIMNIAAHGVESRTSFDYDLPGNITTRTDPNGHRSQYHYDDVNRLTKIVLPDAANTPTYSYTWDLTDQLERITGPDGETRYTYDDLDRLDSVYDFGQAQPLLRFAWDHQDRPTWVTYPDNSQVCYEYDPDGRITAVGRAPRTLSPAHCASPGVERIVYQYDAQGRLIRRAYPNGLESFIAYDPATGLIKTAGQRKTATGELISSDTYAYYPNSRLYQSLTRTTPAGSQTTQYSYDAFERLTSTTESDGKKTDYQYDPFGNRSAEIITNTGNASATGGTPKPYGRYDYVYHPNSNRLKEIRHTAPNGSTATVWESYSYDNAGRITQRTHAVQGSTTYTWDDRGLLTQVIKPGTTLSYTYDALGQRKAKTVNGQTTRYLTAPLFGLSHVLMELAPDMTIQKTYVYGGHDQLIEEPVATDRSKDLYLLHEGTVGSITHATTRTGAIANGYRYEAFGARAVQNTATAAGSYGFTGEQYDDETGLVYLRARYYDPALGRFISPDPFLGRLAEPSTQNRYVYVKNNPLGFVDPSGLDAFVVLYPGASGFGHVGVGVNTMNTTGLYPASGTSGLSVVTGQSVSGAVLPDTRTPIQTIRIPTTPAQDRAMQDYINQRTLNPGNYDLNDRNCVSHVRSVLNAGGIGSPNTILPRQFMGGLGGGR